MIVIVVEIDLKAETTTIFTIFLFFLDQGQSLGQRNSI